MKIRVRRINTMPIELESQLMIPQNLYEQLKEMCKMNQEFLYKYGIDLKRKYGSCAFPIGSVVRNKKTEIEELRQMIVDMSNSVCQNPTVWTYEKTEQYAKSIRRVVEKFIQSNISTEHLFRIVEYKIIEIIEALIKSPSRICTMGLFSIVIVNIVECMAFVYPVSTHSLQSRQVVCS